MRKKKEREEKMNETKNKKGFGKLIMMTSFLSGITGALVAYMTPKTGEIVREKILKMAESLKKSEKTSAFTSVTMLRSGEILNSLNQKVTKLLEHGIKLVEDSKELLASAYVAGKEAYVRGEETNLLEEKKDDSAEQKYTESQSEPTEHKGQQAEESEKEVTAEEPVAQKEEKETPPQQQEGEKEKSGVN